ncbi:MAG: hypothetical protein AB1938_12410 [Myxococcota bacterium]
MNKLSLLIAVGCLAGCASIRPELKARTDQYLASVTPSDKTFGASSAGQVKAWAKGQYVILKTVYKDEPSLLKMSVLSHDAEGFWMQSESLGYRGRSTSKILFRVQPRTLEEAKTAVRRLVTIDEAGKEQVFDFEDPTNPMMGMMRSSMESAWANMVLNATIGGSHTVRVPAGTFEGCVSYSTEVQFAGYRDTHQGFAHFDVPINAAVQSRSQSGDSSLELIAFGEDGGPAL